MASTCLGLPTTAMAVISAMHRYAIPKLSRNRTVASESHSFGNALQTAAIWDLTVPESGCSKLWREHL